MAAFVVLTAGCGGQQVDLVKTLEVVDPTTGWYDAGVVEGGKNRLVPSISFRLKNRSTQDLTGSVQVNAVFRRVKETEEWGSAYVRAVDSTGLPAGAISPPVVLRSNLGYTGTEPRVELLKNRQFVDARAELFVKHGSSQWVKLGDFAIERQLLTR